MPFIISYTFFTLIVLIVMNVFLVRKKNWHTKKEEALDKEVPVGKVLFVLMFGMFIAILNQTILNVALPVMMTDLNVNATTAQWLMTGFMLANGILIPISAFLVENFGFRKLFITAMISFTIGSLVCAVSATFPLVMIGRIIQAIGAGILMPLGMNIFLTVFPPEKRGTAMGTMGIAMILAPAIGPTLSGWVVQNYDWHFLFYAMALIGLIDIFFAFIWFRLEKELTRPTFDIQGIVYSSIGFGGILYGFSEAGSKGWSSAAVIISLMVGVVFLIFFAVRQLNVEKPLLELRVFKYNLFTFTLIINSIVTMALFGGMLLLPIYLQNIRGFTPIESGLLLLPGAMIMGLMGPIAGKIFDRYGVRGLAIVGLAITTYGTYEFTQLTADTPYTTLLGIYMLRSFGMSLIMMPIMTAGMNQLPLKMISHGTAMSNTIRQVAGSIGTALLVTVMTQQSTNHLSDYTKLVSKTDPMLMNQLQALGSSMAQSAGLTAHAGQTIGAQALLGQALQQSTIEGINDAFYIATVLAFIALVLSFFLKTPKKTLQESSFETAKVKTEASSQEL
ncbi:DHA2 family efflux MFS transporter permease subunit [Aeribacillus sp. FSL K6-2833]|uniref:DHA2 family efflux MFS transporter permease subunit n=2 Tax=Aeribacillus sp. FSL K6-2833 TaxID=2954611 RepID=UPI0030D6DC6F